MASLLQILLFCACASVAKPQVQKVERKEPETKDLFDTPPKPPGSQAAVAPPPRILQLMRNMKCDDEQQVFRPLTATEVWIANEISPILSNDEGEFLTESNLLMFKPVACVTSSSRSTLETYADRVTDLSKTMIPGFFAVLTDEVAKSSAENMPYRLMQALCKAMNNAKPDVVKTLLPHFPCLESEEFFKVASKDELLGTAVMTAKLKNGQNPIRWNQIFDLAKKIPVPPEVVKEVPIPNLKANLGVAVNKKNAPVIVQKIPPDTLNATHLKDLGDKTCDTLPLSYVLKIPPKELNDAGDALKCMGEITDKTAARKISLHMVGETRDPDKCMDFLRNVNSHDTKCWKVLNLDNIRTLNSDPKIDKSKLRCDIAMFVKRQAGLQQKISMWNDTEVKLYAWLTRCIPTKAMEKADARLVEAAVKGTLTNATNMSSYLKRKILKEAQRTNQLDLAQITGTEFSKMKVLISTLTPAEAETISRQAIKEKLVELKDEIRKMRKAARRKIFEKLDDEGLKKHLCDLGKLSKDVPVRRLKDIDNLVDILGQENCMFQCGRGGQCAVLFEKMEPQLMQSREARTVAKTSRAICGMPRKYAKDLEGNETMKELAGSYFGADCKQLSTRQLLTDKVTGYNKIVNSSMTVEEAEMLGGNYFKKLAPKEMEGYSAEVMKKVVSLLGQIDLTDRDREWLKNMTALAVKSIKPSGEISNVDVLTLGELVCGLSDSNLGRLTEDAMRDAAQKLSACPHNTEADLAMIRGHLKKKIGSPGDYEKLDDGGTIWLSDCSALDSIDSATKSAALPAGSEAVTAWKEKVAAQNKYLGDPGGKRKAEQDRVAAHLKCGMDKLVDARAANSGRRKRSDTISKPGRVKRQTSSLSCADIDELGEAASTLSASRIASLDADEFDACSDTLGGILDWTPEQKQALASKAQQAWGPATSWPAKDVLVKTGTIAQGLSPQQLQAMKLTLNQLGLIGEKRGWTSPQVEAGLKRHMEQSGSTPASLKSSDLQEMGEFVCGLQTGEIAQISETEFKEAKSFIGEKLCGPDKMEAWSKKAIEALGGVGSWTDADVAALGNIISGLPADLIAKLKPSQVASLSLETLAATPPDKFNGLTVEQLKTFSPEQAGNVSPAQFKALSSDKQKVLVSLGALMPAASTDSKKAGGSTSGAAVSYSIRATLTAVAMAGGVLVSLL